MTSFWPRGFPRGPSNDFDDSKRASIFWTLEIASKPLGKIYRQLTSNHFDDSKRTFIFWTLKINSKLLGKIYGQHVDNLETTWRRLIEL